MSLPEEQTPPRRLLRLLVGPPPVDDSPEGAEHAIVVPGRSDRYLAERFAWSLVWFGVLVAGINFWGSWWSWPVMAALSPLIVLIGLGGIAWSWIVATPRWRAHQFAAFGAVLASLVANEAVNIHFRRWYATDSAAFDHVAANLLSHGVDPYTVPLTGATKLLQTPAQFWTYTINGGHILHVSYPAGSFLVDTPAFLLGFHHEVVDWMDMYAWVATTLLLFLILPVTLRWVAGLVTLIGIFVGVFSSGGTDVIFIPFMMLAVWRWDRYGTGRQAGIARWMGPVALGLACSIKQTPWFCVPFLVLGIAFEAKRRGVRSPSRESLRYLAVVLATFGVVNLPFIIWSPAAWWRGAMTPLVDPLVADGQGLISLATHGVTGGVDLTLLMLASGLAYLVVLVSFAVWYGRLKRIWLLLLPIALAFAPRSLSEYLVDLFPVAIVGALTVGVTQGPALARKLGRFRIASLVVALLMLGTSVTSAVAFSSVPLQISLKSAGIYGRTLESVTVVVHNETGSSVTPHFMVDTGNIHPDGFWFTERHRPVIIAPHGSVTVTVYPPVLTGFPKYGSHWLVEAYTSNPRSLSTSPLIWHGYNPPT